jgi:hypothetical protein
VEWEMNTQEARGQTGGKWERRAWTGSNEDKRQCMKSVDKWLWKFYLRLTRT